MMIDGRASVTAAWTVRSFVMSRSERVRAMTSSPRDSSSVRTSVPTMPPAPVISQRRECESGIQRFGVLLVELVVLRTLAQTIAEIRDAFTEAATELRKLGCAEHNNDDD